MLDGIDSTLIFIFKLIFAFIVIALVILFIYDRYIQRRHQLLINYPIIGRFRYLFEALREPLRQYFAQESFYESRDKIDWVYKAAKDVPNFISFSPSQSTHGSKIMLKHSFRVLNENEVSDDFSVIFGKNRPTPYIAPSPIVRSAMSDGALSPEAVRAFALGATLSRFTLNTGEGGLTTNFFYTHKVDAKSLPYLETVSGGWFSQTIFNIADKIFNRAVALKIYRNLALRSSTRNTYLYDNDSHLLYRINWNAPIEDFPLQTPPDLPNMILQIGSGLYGVRNPDGSFNSDRFAKSMRFCRMSEIKLAQGAKQTGGKLAASKVNADIAYYRGVTEGEDLMSPNRFPFASSNDELFDFIGTLQELSGKPSGVKIVISNPDDVEEFVKTIKDRVDNNRSYPDFISLDSGDGGSATAPLEMMSNIGLSTHDSLYILNSLLEKYDLKDEIKIIISGKILTPDDVVIALAMGADAVGIARGFMMSGGCIRARLCSGTGSHQCPVGLATQNPKLRASYLVVQKAGEIASYHTNLLRGIKTLISVMGVESIKYLNKKQLNFKDDRDEIYFDIDRYFSKKFYS